MTYKYTSNVRLLTLLYCRNCPSSTPNPLFIATNGSRCVWHRDGVRTRHSPTEGHKRNIYPPPSQQDEGGEEKYQKSTEAIHSFTGPLTHTHTLIKRKKDFLEQICAQKSYEIKQTGIVGVHRVLSCGPTLTSSSPTLVQICCRRSTC